MKITDLSTGKQLQFKPGFKLEIERTNPFFNKYGEQSLPADLPDTPQNREITGFAHLATNRERPYSRKKCMISSGHYAAPARMAVLGAKRNEKISVSFYLNDGYMLSEMKDTPLVKLFEGERIEEIGSVEQGISFCKKLTANTHERYAIFPVLVDDGTTDDNGRPVYKWLNRYGHEYPDGSFEDRASSMYTLNFYNATARSEQSGGQTLNVPAGFYITPFVRVNYLLERIFSHYGYELEKNFFTETVQFRNLVVLNNTADTLANGDILLTDLLPNVTVKAFIDVIEQRFGCRFIPDISHRTVSVSFLKDYDSLPPTDALDGQLVGEPEISLPGEYRRLCIRSKGTLSDAGSVNGEGSIDEMKAKHPNVRYDCLTGKYYDYGHVYYGAGNPAFPPGTYQQFLGKAIEVRKEVYPSSAGYDSGGEEETEDIDVDDTPPEFRSAVKSESGGGEESKYDLYVLCVGSPRWMNSTIQYDDGETEENPEPNPRPINTKERYEGEKMPVMFAFSCTIEKPGYTFPRGTVTNYIADYYRNPEEGRIGDYSLCYNGTDGIFERFYRKYDNLLRNSLHTVSARLLLPDETKRDLDVLRPVTLEGARLLVNKLDYSIGDGEEPAEAELFTTYLYEPVQTAPPPDESTPEYVWKVGCRERTADFLEYVSQVRNGLNKFPPAIYMTRPANEEEYRAGKEYHPFSRIFMKKMVNSDLYVFFWEDFYIYCGKP